MEPLGRPTDEADIRCHDERVFAIAVRDQRVIEGAVECGTDPEVDLKSARHQRLAHVDASGTFAAQLFGSETAVLIDERGTEIRAFGKLVRGDSRAGLRAG